MVVGVIGLGIMGSAYARNLIRSGETVFGVDPSVIARAKLAEEGGSVFETVDDWVSDCDAIVLSLAAPHVLASVCEKLATGLRPGQVVVETGTFSLADKEEARSLLEKSGAVLLDCPVSGTGAQAAEADLVMMASGPEEAVAEIRPLLEKFTRMVMYVGDFGNGTKLKFVANHAVAIHNVAAAETLNYADALGLERDTVYRLLSSGAGQSRMSDLRMPLMINGAYDPPSASLKMFEKDLRIIGEDIEEKGVFAPLFEAGRSVYDTTVDELPNQFDTASVFETYKSKSER
ncbi:3-hydroxyisobutyrate dehydrogenase-like beta-hydroxyacid dehydrogenase [Labrenzia sp. EL_208]|nr:3-hydroxyisobutyrate dehydrogenase-like beta-hydroxyacid dehydrogenase [Labrenzia sp. EL_132]MBG6229894.1 3-hydroxyisobutyrate dehydrogenase-like beta-hydroxyacid dehydrogenase [Labrenzia sp. EL_208]